MNKPVDLPLADYDFEDSNTSSNPTFDAVLNARLSRRNILRGSLGTALTAAFGGLSLAACGGGGSDEPAPAPGAIETLLGFTAVAKTLADASTVPAGYTAATVFATGDPLFAGVPAYRNDGTDTGYDRRSGDCHDGMEYFGLSAAGTPDPLNNDRALLGINHEYITQQFLHVAGPAARPRPASETDIEVDCHGVAIVEFAKTAGKFAYVQNSSFNRRVTGLTEIEISGPARGHPLLVTKFSPSATKTRGTINNCGTGKTPWGTLLTGEENWSGYFYRAANDQARRTAKVNTALTRYGRSVTATAGAASRYGWETSGPSDKYQRWDTSVTGSSVDGSDDYRNEINGQGYIVEIDPYRATSVIKKRTALGRMAHESAAFSKPVAGKPLAVYMGDDAQGEYVYKFVSSANWSAADATAANRVAVGDKYLDAGRLYVARFNDDGSGDWVELSMANPTVASYAGYAFADNGDVALHSRLAGDAVGATKMDRPEWCGVHPTNGEIYFTMTNNSNRRLAPTGSQLPLNPANPRAYSDIRGASSTQQGNVNGHIVRLRETGGEPTATSFQWDVYLFGAESGASPTLINLSGLTDDQDFSSPDGLVFSASTGLCWIQTDDGAYTDTTNCMMLAGLPGQLGDGGNVTLNYGTTSVTTRMGKKAIEGTLKRLFVGPAGNEITGMCETPDGKVMFINVQHPGDDTPVSDISNPSRYVSHWPGNGGYGAGGALARPRSATVMITKNDGGRIGT
ncbi:PhoX family protein [Piscinibacter koreensis]|uniref:PhoX family phosphatase n=1 Tax=Piscinibacter koreensis TaxID=2742824 RepID=A0A7Y6NT98_9BURK|nr:PhoX family phosphatase [Schlegelella koreensis]NUZ08894.1 PhoX family phosphatase [Schlegelella koreensis]